MRNQKINKKHLFLILIFLILLSYIISSNGNVNYRSISEYFLNQPSSLPDFISSIRIIDQLNESILCLVVWQGAFWNIGDDPAITQSNIIEGSTLFINEKPLTDVHITLLGMFPRDRSGNITENFGPDIEFCYELKLEKNSYTLKFNVQFTQDINRSYSWEIQANENG